MTRRAISHSPDLWFESAHGSRESARAKAHRLVTEPARGDHLQVVRAQVWYRGVSGDTRTRAERDEDHNFVREGWQ
jgi:hypothetical protein